MSLAVFKTELVPSPALRKFVLLSAAAALLAGTIIIMHLPLSLTVRGVLCSIWILDCSGELNKLRRGSARICRLQIEANGDIFATGPGGRSEYLELLSGSVVLSRLAWLRLRFPDGSVGAEFLAGDPRSDPRWQGLQLIWQQNRAAFAAKNQHAV
jgi:hypothetical protein